MKKSLAVMVAVLLVAAGAYAASAFASGKLPRCSKTDCRSIGCPSDVLCSSGSTVKTCAEVCNGK